MSYLKKPEDIVDLRYSCRILMSFLEVVKNELKPGQDCGDWNDFCGDFISFYKGKPSFLGHYKYKYNVCISINNEVVHGIAPKGKIIPDNSLVSFDCGVIYNGLYSDSAYTHILGNVPEKAKKMVETCKESLQAGISVVRSGVKVRDISKAVNDVIQKEGFGNVVDLGGHGVGYSVWAEPFILHKPEKHEHQKTSLFTNKLICIEPMITMGSHEVLFDETEEDGWTVTTKDGSLSCHFEHELLVTKDGCEVLTDIKDFLDVPQALIEKYKNLIF
ncbi:MAG: type I methionyl aminopeptidase [Patescibacteria group bacterium]